MVCRQAIAMPLPTNGMHTKRRARSMRPRSTALPPAGKSLGCAHVKDHRREGGAPSSKFAMKRGYRKETQRCAARPIIPRAARAPWRFHHSQPLGSRYRETAGDARLRSARHHQPRARQHARPRRQCRDARRGDCQLSRYCLGDRAAGECRSGELFSRAPEAPDRTNSNLEFGADFHDLRAWNLEICAGPLGVMVHECEQLLAPSR